MRRRNIKNAHERLINDSIFVLNYEEQCGKWNQLFNNDNPIYLEIGMGKGKFIIEHAKRNPNINFIGFEKYESVIIQAPTKLKEQNLELPNLKLVCADATDLEKIFSEEEITKIFLNFSDPWPKNKHAKRRLTSEIFLRKYEKVLKKDGIIEFKTDNRGLFEYSLISLNNEKWTFLDLSLDLHSRDEDIITTEYEDRFSEKGNQIYYLEVKK